MHGPLPGRARAHRPLGSRGGPLPPVQCSFSDLLDEWFPPDLSLFSLVLVPFCIAFTTGAFLGLLALLR